MKLMHLPEPALLFRHDQAIEYPRDGLALFGPLDKGSPFGIRSGVIGTKDGLRRFRDWASKLQTAVIQSDPEELFQLSHPAFPGSRAAFRIPWNVSPVHEIEIRREDLNKSLYLCEQASMSLGPSTVCEQNT